MGFDWGYVGCTLGVDGRYGHGSVFVAFVALVLTCGNKLVGAVVEAGTAFDLLVGSEVGVDWGYVD